MKEVLSKHPLCLCGHSFSNHMKGAPRSGVDVPLDLNDLKNRCFRGCECVYYNPSNGLKVGEFRRFEERIRHWPEPANGFIYRVLGSAFPENGKDMIKIQKIEDLQGNFCPRKKPGVLPYSLRSIEEALDDPQLVFSIAEHWKNKTKRDPSCSSYSASSMKYPPCSCKHARYNHYHQHAKPEKGFRQCLIRGCPCDKYDETRNDP